MTQFTVPSAMTTSGIRARIDPLLHERAEWLFSGRPGTGLARRILNRLLSYDRTIAIGDALDPLGPEEVMAEMAELLARDVEVTGLENLPRQGAAMVVANHPTGIADGIILHHVLAKYRPDAYYFANRDILRVLPQFETMIAPVEWRLEKRSHATMRETMAFTRKAVEEGRLGVIFPSGRLAKRRWLRLHEREWMPSAAMISRKFDLPVIPVNIRARNSWLFYLFDLIHPSLRDITLFHETLNKGRQPFRITMGQPIAAGSLPTKSEDGIQILRKATLALGGRYAPEVSLVELTRRPAWARKLVSSV